METERIIRSRAPGAERLVRKRRHAKIGICSERAHVREKCFRVWSEEVREHGGGDGFSDVHEQ